LLNAKQIEMKKKIKETKKEIIEALEDENINAKDLTDLKICDGRITEKPTTKKDIIKWLKTDRLKGGNEKW